VDALDDFVFEQQLGKSLSSPHSPIHGRDPSEIRAATAPVRGPERLLDLAIRTGPWGDAYGARPEGLSIAKLLASPHGVDLGPLEPRIPEVLRTPSGRIELAPEPLVGDLERLRAFLRESSSRDGMVLVGRRDLRSNNSWGHNLVRMVKGPTRCTLKLHPRDAEARGITAGDAVTVTSRTGAVTAPAEVSDEVMPGVASLPHGWGHNREGTRMGVASAHAGVSLNDVTDEESLDALCGTATLTGVPVRVARVAPATEAAH
jgi:anaerobic selenocysteine-containing dehydrogenase